MSAFGLEAGPASVILCAITGSIWSLLVFLIRIFLRLRVNGPVGKDDLACGAATAATITYSSFAVAEVGLGYGSTQRHLSAHARETVLIVGWVASFFFWLASGLSKVSACFLVARMTETKEHLVVIYSVLSAVLVWLAVCMFLVVFQCKMPHPWVVDPNNICINRVSRLAPRTRHVLTKQGRPVDRDSKCLVRLGAYHHPLGGIHGLGHPDATQHQSQSRPGLLLPPSPYSARRLPHRRYGATALEQHAGPLRSPSPKSIRHHSPHDRHRIHDPVRQTLLRHLL